MGRNLKNDTTLEELAQNELLIGLKEQIDYIKEFGKSETIDFYELCDKVFDKYLENLTYTEGYDTFVENNENSLKIIEHNKINADNILLGDMMIFHNAISDNLGVERIYSKNDVLKEFNCKQNMELDI